MVFVPLGMTTWIVGLVKLAGKELWFAAGAAAQSQ